jgi:hypothetical protein
LANQAQHCDLFSPMRHFVLARWKLPGPASADRFHSSTGVKMKMACSKQLRRRRPLVVENVHLLSTMIVVSRAKTRPTMQCNLQSRGEGDPHSVGASVGCGSGWRGFAPGTEDQRQRPAPQRLPAG